MIERVVLRNYRGFEEHEVKFGRENIVVGHNNAGKTSLVEALRLIGLVSVRALGSTYHKAPSWTQRPFTVKGVRPSLRLTGLDLATAIYHYREPPAEIIAEFTDGVVIHVYVGDESSVFGVIYDAQGKNVKSRGSAGKASIPQVAVLPQLRPLSAEEHVLERDYVRGAAWSALAPAHFRNQLKLSPGEYRRFRSLVEQSWRGVRIDRLSEVGTIGERKLHLYVRCEDFVAEAASMGHGLQIWLQIIWFLIRAAKSPTIILDEPDVYLHPDLQRALARLLRNRAGQTIMTTHSTEILDEVPAENILIINRRSDHSDFAPSLPAVQAVIERMGSSHNIYLTRLWNSRRFLLVEGGDVGILCALHSLLFPDSKHSLDAIPRLETQGWGNWQYAAGSGDAMRNAVGETISVYCILDSDYHLESDIKKREADAHRRRINLHIWTQKEIENYLLHAQSIARLIRTRSDKTLPRDIEVTILNRIQLLSESAKEEAECAIADALQLANKGWTAGRALKEARKELARRVENRGTLAACVSGKRILSKLSDWSKKEYGVSFGAVTVARSMLPEEIHSEMKGTLESIEDGRDFASRTLT